MAHRPLYEIAREILKDWKTVSPTYRQAYVEPLLQGNQVTDIYFIGDYHSVISTFLCNATTWRGETARRIKAELKQILKEY